MSKILKQLNTVESEIEILLKSTKREFCSMKLFSLTNQRTEIFLRESRDCVCLQGHVN